MVPTVGMKFLSDEEVFEFYRAYSYKVGFPVKRRNSKKGDDGELRYVTFACCREGNRSCAASSSIKQKPTIQLGCKAKLTACVDMLGMWRITGVHLEHNHKISPSKSRLYRCNRQLNEHVKRKLEVNDVAGIPLHKSYNSCVVEEGGYKNLTFVEKDCRNYTDKVRKLRLGKGDAAAIMAYFSKMQAQCPGFYFNVDLDNDFRLKNIFWADNRFEKQIQQLYTISKFKEVQSELIGMMFCDVLSSEEEFTGTREDVKLLLDRFILRRWRRDVQRAYTRVKINYFGWVSTPEQVRYDQLFKTFGKVANMVVDDDVRTRDLMEFLENHMNELFISKPSMPCGSNLLTRDCTEVVITKMGPICDPTCKKTNGAPRKIRSKGPLEKANKKTKVG
ncbi:Protein FAR1-RELATED SEQUENCE 5 [Abeliophyllum distichum]|uniref:Protein FAR1-RELATED SEQUENCE 5 n=1 Tax=Abeliophyllum distichum TaxID=126358 RepID=A0ABD1QEF1_9LAMI